MGWQLRSCSGLVLASAWVLSGCGGGEDGGEDADVEFSLDDGRDESVVDDGRGDGEVDGEGDGPWEADVPGEDVEPEADAEPDEATDGEEDEGTVVPSGCIEGTFQVYYGNLHAHTSNSDGSGSPEEAFAWARDMGHLDIMFVTDHLEQLYLGLDRWSGCRDAADAANAPGTYVAMCGFEYGSGLDAMFRPSGHNNVFYPEGLFPPIQRDFHNFYRSLVDCAGCIGQYNHPGDGVAQHWNHFEYFADVDERMTLYEFNSDPAWDMFFQALDAGWHISPVYDQDNHGADWGTKNDNRSGLWLTALDRESLYTGMLERRSFATTDKNAAVRMMAEDTCWMGSILSGYPTVDLEVEATDTDATDSFATIELYGPAQTLLETFDCAGASPCTATFSYPVTDPTYFVARVTQTDGGVLVAAPIWASP
jgi:hypothetical protein